MNRLIKSTSPDYSITNFAYDSQNNLTKLTDAENRKTEFDYDDFGRKISALSPDTGAASYSYDDAGNLISKTGADGAVISYEYDALNRMTVIHYPDQDIQYFWDQGDNAKGRLTGFRDSTGQTLYGYDPLGRVISEAISIQGVENPFQLTYFWDNASNMTSMSYPSGRTVSFERDSIGRVIKVTTSKGGVVETLAENITYLPFGPTTGFTYGNGAALSYTFDQGYRLDSITDSSFQKLDYSYDSAGNINGITDTIDPTKSQTFLFDLVDRLVKATGNYGIIQYTYDKTGNRLTRTKGGQTDSYIYEDGTSRLFHTIGENSSFMFNDEDGNMLLDVDLIENIGNTSAINYKIFIYNSNNQLVEVEKNEVLIAKYKYNANGQRVSKTAEGKTTNFLYDLSGNLIGEANESGQIQKEYIWLNGRLLAIIQYDTTPDAIYFYHIDHLGTPKLISDMSGSVVWKADHTPFGSADVSVIGTDNDIRFPGQYYDAETGLHYNWHRYYDPSTGRYLTPDPIGLAGGMNLFVYSLNNPINFIDPEGLNPFGNLFNSIRFAGQEINPFARQRKTIENLPTPIQLIATHYNRNDYNQMVSYQDARDLWNGDVPALFHQLPGWSFEWDNLGNQKFVSPDGHSELVFDSNGNLVSDCLNMGTYNFVSPTDDKFGHFLYDMIPYFLLGNCPEKKCE